MVIKEKFADPRRTEILPGVEGDFSPEELVADEDIVVTITHFGYIKRLPVTTYRSQRRGGRGITALQTKEEDFVEHLFITSTHDYVLFFTNAGRVYRLRGFEIPEASRQARGTAIINLIPVEPGERVAAVIPVKEFSDNHFLVMCTKKGLVKKTALSEYKTGRKTGLQGITLVDEDELINVRLTDGKRELTLVTENGQSIRFNETEIRTTGRVSQGVKGITLRSGDQVIGMDVVKDDAELLVITEFGFGKRTLLSQYRQQARGGMGIKTLRQTEKNGKIIGVKVVYPEHELMLISANGVIIRVAVKDIPSHGRDTQGVKIMSVRDEERVVALARVVGKEEENGE